LSKNRDEVCILLETLWRITIKIHQNLSEALERTPHIISSRALIDSSLKLSSSLINITEELRRAFSCEDSKEY
jgi:hypothetical protein